MLFMGNYTILTTKRRVMESEAPGCSKVLKRR